MENSETMNNHRYPMEYNEPIGPFHRTQNTLHIYKQLSPKSLLIEIQPQTIKIFSMLCFHNLFDLQSVVTGFYAKCENVFIKIYSIYKVWYLLSISTNSNLVEICGHIVGIYSCFLVLFLIFN